MTKAAPIKVNRAPVLTLWAAVVAEGGGKPAPAEPVRAYLAKAFAGAIPQPAAAAECLSSNGSSGAACRSLVRPRSVGSANGWSAAGWRRKLG